MQLWRDTYFDEERLNDLRINDYFLIKEDLPCQKDEIILDT